MAATVGAEDIETVYDVLLEMAETSPAVHDKHIQAQHKGLHMETRSNLGKNHSRLSTQLKVALAVIIVTLIAIIVFLGIREGTGKYIFNQVMWRLKLRKLYTSVYNLC